MNRNTKRFAFGIILAILLFTILMACSSLLFKSYMLLTVETDRPCDLTVFYDNGAEEGYCFDDAHLSQGDVLSAGKQTVKIYIPQEGLRRLRLDFGNAPCNIAIYQLEIVPNFTQSYRLSAEEVFHEFGVLNDISQSSCKDGVVDYAVSGTDGFIATSDNLIKENAKISYANFIFRTILLLGFSVCTSVCVVFSKSILHLIKKFGKFVRQNRIAKVIFCFLVTFIVLGACTLLLFKPHIVLTVESDEACDLDVYFDNGAQVGNCFDDAHLVRGHTLSGGKQTVKIYIPRGGLNRLRFDFGNAPCNIAIYQLEIVPDFAQSYRLSAEEVFHEFSVLNDISQSSCKDGVVNYAVSGTDGFIAASEFMAEKTPEVRTAKIVMHTLLLVCVSIGIAFLQNIFCALKKVAEFLCTKYKQHPRSVKRIVVVALLEIGTVFLSPQYWLIGTLFSVTVGCSICYLGEYVSEDKTLFRDYGMLALLCIMALFPFFLTGFAYGDSYVNLQAGRTPSWVMSCAIAMKRPFVGITSACSINTSVEGSYILRMCLSVGIVVCAILLYRFILEKMNSKPMALLLCIFLCASVITVDCIAYLAVYPIVFSLLLSAVAYLEWESFVDKIEKGCHRESILYGLAFAGSLLAAFCMYQIGTPIFFVMLVISVLDEEKQDKRVIKKGITAVISYGVIALTYLILTSWLQKIFGIQNTQSERAAFIHTLPLFWEKIVWFFTEIIPQSIYRIWASVLPGSLFSTNNLFYTITFNNTYLQGVLLIFTIGTILFYFARLLLKKQWQKFCGCLCGIPLSFYPFLILPESTVLTYYMLPLIMLLDVLFLQGLREILRSVKHLRRDKAQCYWKAAVLLVTVFVTVNSAKYANNWVLYCRDSYQYIKQCIVSNNSEDMRNIHVLGRISPYVGSGPYVVAAVERVIEEIGGNPAEYTITQSDTSYSIEQLTGKNVEVLKRTLSDQDYQRIMGFYEYNKYYECYYLNTNYFLEEDKEFLTRCLTDAELIPSANDKTTLIISLTGFHQTHSF